MLEVGKCLVISSIVNCP